MLAWKNFRKPAQRFTGRISFFGRVGALRRPGRRGAASLPRNCPKTEMRPALS